MIISNILEATGPILSKFYSLLELSEQKLVLTVQVTSKVAGMPEDYKKLQKASSLRSVALKLGIWHRGL